MLFYSRSWKDCKKLFPFCDYVLVDYILATNLVDSFTLSLLLVSCQELLETTLMLHKL